MHQVVLSIPAEYVCQCPSPLWPLAILEGVTSGLAAAVGQMVADDRSEYLDAVSYFYPGLKGLSNCSDCLVVRSTYGVKFDLSLTVL